MVGVEFGGIEIILSKYRRFPGLSELSRVIDSHVAAMQLELMHYPPPPPSSRYRRTGRLRGGWTHSRGRMGVGRLTNTVPYAQYVQGPRQARIHQGRWPRADLLATRVYGPRMVTSIRSTVQRWAAS